MVAVIAGHTVRQVMTQTVIIASMRSTLVAWGTH
jgi:hypothetical protein